MVKRIVPFGARAGMVMALALLVAMPVMAQQGWQLYEWSGSWSRNPAGDYGYRFVGDSETTEPAGGTVEGGGVTFLYYPGMNGGYAFYSPYYAPQFAYQQPGPATTSGSQSLYSPQDDGERGAQINISAPPNAEIWFGDTKVSHQNNGGTRQFASPPLRPGRDYTYDIKVRWMEDGQPVTRNRTVEVHAGDVVNLMFISDQY